MKGGTGFVRFSRASTETTRSDGGPEVLEDLLGRRVRRQARVGAVELQLLAAPGDGAGREEGLPLRELERDGEVRDGAEALPLRLALHDDPERHRLDAPRREAPPDLLPEEVGDLVADEPVDDPARLLRGDPVRVDLARARDRLLDGAPGDLVELGAVEARRRAPRAGGAPRGASRSPRPRGRGRPRGRCRRRPSRAASGRRSSSACREGPRTSARSRAPGRPRSPFGGGPGRARSRRGRRSPSRGTSRGWRLSRGIRR